MVEIYLDECGYTGEDLFNPDQKIFVIASIKIDPNEAHNLKTIYFHDVNSRELKHSKLCKYYKQQRMVINFLNYGKTTYTYDVNNNMIELLTQVWDGSNWVNDWKWTYTYIITEIEQITDGIKTYSLSNNYPNPFNPSTTIYYSIPELSSITLKIYDVLGNEIATLVNEEKPAGSYEVEFSVGQNSILSLSSGIYFYQLRASIPSTGSGQGFVETRKMVLLK